jgi:competence protein ComGC
MKNKYYNFKKNKGFAAIEYLVISFMLISILFMGDPSLASQVVTGLKRYYKALSFIISLP